MYIRHVQCTCPQGKRAAESVTQGWKDYNLKRKVQVTWFSVYPWALPVKTAEGFDRVKCHPCTQIRGPGPWSAMELKKDTLKKHDEGPRHLIAVAKLKERAHDVKARKAGERRWTDVVTRYEVRMLVYIFNCLFKLLTLLFVCVQDATVQGKVIQMATLLHLLGKGRPVTDYEDIQQLLTVLSVENLPSMHWSDSSGWSMVESMDRMVVNKTRELMAGAVAISWSADEVTSIGAVGLLGVHVYCLSPEWTRKQMFCSLPKLTAAPDAEHLSKLVLDALGQVCGLSRVDIARKVVCGAGDGASVMLGEHTGVLRRIQKQAPFMVPVHCFAHRGNLCFAALSVHLLVQRIERVLSASYSLFSHSSKRQAEFREVQRFVSNASKKLTRRVETRWISMLKPAQALLSVWPSLLVWASSKQQEIPECVWLVQELTTFSTLLAFYALMPLLLVINSIVKVCPKRGAFVRELTEAVKEAKRELHDMYINTQTSFQGPHFKEWDRIAVSDESPLQYMRSDLYYVVERAVAGADGADGEQAFRVTDMVDSGTRRRAAPVTSANYDQLINRVKEEARAVATTLIGQLETRMPPDSFLSACEVIYPDFWTAHTSEEEFDNRYQTLKEHFCEAHTVGQSDIPPFVNAADLDRETPIFVDVIATAASNLSRKKSAGKLTDDLVVAFWKEVDLSPLNSRRLANWRKVAVAVLTMVGGSVENERVFSNLAYVKNSVRNRLDVHLEQCVRLFSQDHYDLATFPYDDALRDWNPTGSRYGMHGVVGAGSVIEVE